MLDGGLLTCETRRARPTLWRRTYAETMIPEAESVSARDPP